MSKAATKALIDEKITGNGVQAITGPILNNVLNTMVDDYGTQDEVSQLAQDVDDFKDISDTFIQIVSVESPNLFNKETVSGANKGISKNSGNLFTYSGAVGSDFIPIPNGATSLYPTVHLYGGSAGWAIFDANKDYIRGGNATPIPIESGDAYVRFTLPSDSDSLNSAMLIVGTAADVPAEYMPYGTITSYNVKEDVIGEEQIKDESITTDKIADGAVTAEKLAPGSVNIPDGAITTGKLAEESVTEQKTSFISVVEHKSTNLLNPATCQLGYIRSSDGAYRDVTQNRYATDFIPVDSAGIYLNCYNTYGTGGGYAVYDENKQYIRGGTENPNTGYVYQTGDAYIRITISTSGLGTSYYVVKASDPHEYVPYFEPYYTKSLSDDIAVPTPSSIPAYEPALSLAGKVGTKGTGDTISNETISLNDYPQYIKRCFNLSAVGKITTFGQLDLGVGKDTANGTFLRVDGTSIYFCRYYQGAVHYLFTQAHGLTITDFVDVSVYMNDGEMTARIATYGGIFKYTFTKQIDMESYGIPFVTANENTALTGFSFRAAGVRFRLPIWVIGDSYCSWYSQRWPKQLSTSFDVTDFLLDGLAGGGSGTMFAELQKMLNYGTPKFLIWCLGMNDTFNDWNGIYTMLKELCEEKGITLVLQTIPWPENNASGAAQKALINAEIKASGLRYFDGYAAVSSDENGTWYTGYCADEVHPSVEGAKAMAARFIVDFPEILQ